jgi:hypothetical protein
MHKTNRATAATAVAIATLMALPMALSASAAAPEPVYVPASAVGTDSSDATPHWVNDDSGNGAFAATSDSFDGISPVLKMTTPGSGDQVRVLKRYGTTLPPDIQTLLNGASYTYTGSNADFQIEIFFTPKNLSEYGPNGTTNPCTQAKSGSTVIPDQCYTVLKWAPLQTLSGTWKTVDLTANTALSSEAGVGGWKNTNVVGIYPKPGALIGNTLSEYLAQIENYQVIGAGIALGSGAPNSTSWIKNLTFGGTEYRFGSAPTPQPQPATAPAADSASLATLLAANNVDVTATTNSFVADAGSSSPGSVDFTKPFSGSMPWVSNDNFVDVYAYSSPLYLGAFPVVNGRVILTNLDLSRLGAGSHQLVLLGQNSKALSAVALTARALLPTPAAPATPVKGNASFTG